MPITGRKQWRLPQAAVAAALAGVGGSLTAWPISMPAHEIAPATRHWLAVALATVRSHTGRSRVGLRSDWSRNPSRGAGTSYGELPCFAAVLRKSTQHIRGGKRWGRKGAEKELGDSPVPLDAD